MVMKTPDRGTDLLLVLLALISLVLAVAVLLYLTSRAPAYG